MSAYDDVTQIIATAQNPDAALSLVSAALIGLKLGPTRDHHVPQIAEAILEGIRQFRSNQQ